MAHKVGDRIGAIFSGEEGTIAFLGYGTYEGEEIPGPEAAGFLAECCRESKHPNPKLRLDNGDIVWGCECWWGDWRAVAKQLDKAVSVWDVRISDMRKKALGEKGE